MIETNLIIVKSTDQIIKSSLVFYSLPKINFTLNNQKA